MTHRIRRVAVLGGGRRGGGGAVVVRCTHGGWGERDGKVGGRMTHRIRRVAVLGAGTMGAAIAAHCANAGMEVDLLDIAPQDGDDKNAVVKGGFDRMKKARPAALMSERVLERMRIGNFEDDFERVAEADWILEAIIEKLEPKQELMERVEELAKDDAIISSNTSGIPLHQVAEGRSESFKKRFPGRPSLDPPGEPKLLRVL